MVENRHGSAVQDEYKGLKKTYNMDSTIIGYPVIKATLDAVKVVVDCIQMLQTSEWLTLQFNFPTM